MDEEFDASSDVIFNYGYGCCPFAHDICESEPMILAGMPDTSEPLCPKFFYQPPSASSDPPSTTTIREEPSASSPLAVVDGTYMPPKPPTRTDGEYDVVADG